MNKIERVTAVIEGRQPDRSPVSFWHHFDPECAAGPRAIEAHLRHAETYDLDFLKVMYDNPYPLPRTSTGLIADIADLERLTVLGGDEDTFGKQLELIGALADHFAGSLYMATTVFNSWTTLRRMTAPAPAQQRPPSLSATEDPRDRVMSRSLREAPEALGRALNVVAESLANFARHCVAAGADGVFLSVRDDAVDTLANGLGQYDRLVRPGDLQILAGARQGTFNVLHVCSKAVDFSRFAEYPIHVINWADRYAGPSIAAVAGSIRPAICAGLDNLATMVTGSPEDCERQVMDALVQAGDRPIMIGPGCTFDPLIVPPENLHAIRMSVERCLI